jgi:hypothetical protein
LKGGQWSQIFGSKEKERAFAREDRRGHRSEERKQRVHGKLQHSKPVKMAA